MRSPEWSPTGKAARQIDTRPCWTPLAPSMRMNVPEVVGNADGDALGVEEMIVEPFNPPKLILIICTYPDVAPRAILDPTAWGIDGPPVCRIPGGEPWALDMIHATVIHQELPVGVDVAEVAPSIDWPAPGSSQSQAAALRLTVID